MLGRRRRERHERHLAELDAFRLVRRAADEDVTRFGEELSQLHFETLAADLDDTTRGDYQKALDAYEDAKASLGKAATGSDVTSVTSTLADGRFHHACVLAAQAGGERPERRPPCFFDPAHGPATRDVEWAPPGGVAREVPVCFRDAERLAAGEQPAARLVRLGDRHVAWFASGPAYAAWAGGWYADLVSEGRMEADRLTMTWTGMLPGAGGAGLPIAAAWADPGAWADGGMIGGHDFGHGGFGHGGFGDGGHGGGGHGGGGHGGGHGDGGFGHGGDGGGGGGDGGGM